MTSDSDSAAMTSSSCCKTRPHVELGVRRGSCHEYGALRLSGLVFTATVVAAVVAAACGSDSGDEQTITLTGQALQDPRNCLPCHAEQFREWSGSMHAYAAEDPVFLAMNKRMLRETNGASKDFCVSCHAPLAFRLGLTSDGANLADVPPTLRGVTCYFCHSATAVSGTHNAAIELAKDDTLRGGIFDPTKSMMPHRAVYSPLHDREAPESSTLCGACHDVITPHGAHIERTFAEWKESLYAQPGQLACGKCHMEGREGRAAQLDGVPLRRIHDHKFPAVDVALTPFPEAEAQRAAVQRTLDSTILAKLCVTLTPVGPTIDVTLDNAFAGHSFPSGAAQDRRVWLELVAEKGGAEIFSTGKVEDRKAAASLADPNLWLLRDRIFSADGRETHMFWEAARFESTLLPPAVTADPLDPRFNHSVTRTFNLVEMPDRVAMRVRMRPIDFDLLDDLVATGDLDPAVLDKIPTFDLASGTREWTAERGVGCVQ